MERDQERKSGQGWVFTELAGVTVQSWVKPENSQLSPRTPDGQGSLFVAMGDQDTFYLSAVSFVYDSGMFK